MFEVRYSETIAKYVVIAHDGLVTYFDSLDDIAKHCDSRGFSFTYKGKF